MKINMKTARKNCHLTQGDIASAFGFCIQTVYKWEMGLAPVAKKHWPRLASLLHLSESELESVLVETLLDACIAKQDARPLLNAQTSRLYNAELIADALARFGGSARYPAATAHNTPLKLKEPGADYASREKILELERAVFERDKKIFELEKEIEHLRKELASISSKLTGKQLENEVNHV